MKKNIIIANWKLNGNIDYISKFLIQFKSQKSYLLNKSIISIAPPMIYLDRVHKYIRNTNISLSSQNVDIHVQGAFTGETSIAMLKDIGVRYVIIGHSERRYFHNEDNIIISKKFSLVKKFNLIPILCIGENKEEKENNYTKQVIKQQLHSILNICGKNAFRNTIIAYEPIWAVGTGISSDPEYVQSIHKFIKNYINTYDSLTLDTLLIQYGGSVDSTNTEKLLKKPDIDGLLIGSASLNIEEFLNIIQISNNTF